jgi:hypothetical protein
MEAKLENWHSLPLSVYDPRGGRPHVPNDSKNKEKKEDIESDEEDW